MGFTRVLRVLSGVGIAGALVLTSAPSAVADQTRNDQWALKAFDADAIWKISTGKGVTVAVIDSGVNANHVDLVGNVIEGKDFSPGQAAESDADSYHGTQMASVIAGHGHGPGDANGVMGLAPDAKILDVRDLGTGSDGFASSIRYAVDHGASVINISQESDGPNAQDAESKAIAYALQKNVLVVAGAGNTGTAAGYPASYPGVLGVGGVQNDGKIWAESNYGPNVLLAAPATSIVAAGGASNTSYRVGTGTSDSTAYVSAAAALLRAKFPDLTPGQIANRLTKTAGLPASAKGTSLPDQHYGYGFIQPLAALKQDIPAGSKYGPLTVPESLKQSSSTAPAAADDSSSSSNNSLKRVLVFGGLGLIALVIVVLIIFLIVKISRRNNNGGGPGGGAPAGYVPGQPPYGQQPQGNPYTSPQHGQGSYPNQPQQQPPSSWGGQ